MVRTQSVVVVIWSISEGGDTPGSFLVNTNENSTFGCKCDSCTQKDVNYGFKMCNNCYCDAFPGASLYWQRHMILHTQSKRVEAMQLNQLLK